MLPDFANRTIDQLQAKYPPNRIVALATPIVTPVVAAGAAAGSAWLAAHFPGLPAMPVAALTAIIVAAILGVVYLAGTLADKFIDGWQKDEARKHEASEAHWDRLHRERVAMIEQGQVPGDQHSRIEA